MEESKRLSQAASLCRSLLTPAERFEEAYFEAVRTLLSRLSGNKQITRKIIDERIYVRVAQSTQSKQMAWDGNTQYQRL